MRVQLVTLAKGHSDSSRLKSLVVADVKVLQKDYGAIIGFLKSVFPVHGYPRLINRNLFLATSLSCSACLGLKFLLDPLKMLIINYYLVTSY